MFGFGKKQEFSKLPTKFEMPLERRVGDGRNIQFNIRVSGSFLGKGGKPTFSISAVEIDGAPNTDLSTFSSAEIAQIERYAIDVQYKKLLGSG